MTEGKLSIGQALDLGAKYAMEGNHQTAIELFRGVLLHEPQNFEAILRLGSSLFELGQHHEALYWFWRGRKISRRHPLALSNYGLCLSQLGHPDEAVPDLERAAANAEKDPNPYSPAVMALVYNNLGNTLERLRRYPEALAALDKGIKHDPTDPFPHYNRGIVLLRLNRHREAIDALDRSLTSRGAATTDTVSRLNHADAHYNRGMARLLLGDLRRGFADYEYRLITSENVTPHLGLPADRMWKGEPIEGKTVLVHAEQGLGDTIQFARFLPWLVHEGANVQLVVHTALREFIDIPGVAVLPAGAKLEGYDYWVALMSLPLRMGIRTEAEIPSPWVPEAGSERIAKWYVQMGEQPKSRLRIGVCWAGNWRHKNNEHRSIDLRVFGRLFDVPVDFVSLQQMQQCDTETFAALKGRHENLQALWLNDWRDTAAAMLNLDLVVSVDTAVAHLAASLGLPTWIFIPRQSCDWRWMLERSDSPWYPSVRLFRQERIGDWASTINKGRDALQRLADSRTASQAA